MSEQTPKDSAKLEAPTKDRIVSRRALAETAAMVGLSLTALSASAQYAVPGASHTQEEIKKQKIRRAMLAGPASITSEAAIADMDREGHMTVLRPGTNDWFCMPGDQNVIGKTDMCVDPMGMVWWKDLLARKSRPTNTSPGLIYMLNGATQRSYTDPFDTTSPAIPIGPHWMLIWPFDAKAAGLSTVMRDAGTMVMFAGTPYAHLHICGDPWEGNQYHSGDRGVWKMAYSRP